MYEDRKFYRTLVVPLLFFISLISDATADFQNLSKQISRLPKRQILINNSHMFNVFSSISPRTNVKHSLTLATNLSSTSEPEVVRSNLTSKVKFDKQFLRTQWLDVMEIGKKHTPGNRTAQQINNNVFIEFGMQRAHIPQTVISEKLNYSVTSRPYKEVEMKSASVNVDNKDYILLDKIQLENELKQIKNQVQNDTKTIDDLKSKVLDKEFNALNESHTNNNDIFENVNGKQISWQEDFDYIKESSEFKTKYMDRVQTTKSQTEAIEIPALYVPNMETIKKYLESKNQKKSNSYKNNNKRGKLTSSKSTTSNSDTLENITENEYKHGNNVDKFKDFDSLNQHIKETIAEKSIQTNSKNNQFTTINVIKDIHDNSNEGTDGKEYYHSGTDRNRISEDVQLKKDLDDKQSINAIENDLAVSSGKKNVSDTVYIEDLEEDFGRVNPGDGPYDFERKRNRIMDSKEYQTKLQKQRIDDEIDWNTFDHDKFLALIGAEVKQPKNAPYVPERMLTQIPYSGRRMLSNIATLTNAEVLPTLNENNQEKNSKDRLAIAYAPAPPRRRKLVLTTRIPIPSQPALVDYDEFSSTTSVNLDDNNFFVAPYHITVNPKIGRRNYAPRAGDQKILIDSTELLIRNVLGRFNSGKMKSQTPYDFEIMKQKLNREGNIKRRIMHNKVARRMNLGRSGRRNMNPTEINYDNYNSKELAKDPFLNDALI